MAKISESLARRKHGLVKGLPVYVQDCDDATERDPKEFAAWFDRGNILVRLEDYKKALASYTKAADLAPGISGKPLFLIRC